MNTSQHQTSPARGKQSTLTRTSTRILSPFVFLISWKLHCHLPNCPSSNPEVRMCMHPQERRRSNSICQALINLEILISLNPFPSFHICGHHLIQESIIFEVLCYPLQSHNLYGVARTVVKFESGHIHPLIQCLLIQDKIRSILKILPLIALYLSLISYCSPSFCVPVRGILYNSLI